MYFKKDRSPIPLLSRRAGHGTPRLLVRPRTAGARPSRARPTRIRDAKYRAEFPAEMTVWNE